jgi:NAD(P)-dependent dehydrogenase (short-subunit alcohol dehydrogenase family)
MSSKEKWTSENVPDQSGRVAVVTGSSSGLGYENARVLANKNAKVIVAVRNQQKGDKAVENIKAQNSNADVSVMILDLANLQSVKDFVAEFRKKYDRLDLLINNAGVMMPPYGKTADGFELQFGTNHIGHFVLTAQLIDLIEKTSGSRIVNVSSMAHNYGDLDFDDLTWEKRSYNKMKSYGDSKIANLYFTYELQRKLDAAGYKTIATASHPGWTATDLQRHAGLFSFLNFFFAMKVEQGALPTLRAAIDENVKGGDYYGPDGWKEWRGDPVKVDSNQPSKDKSIAQRLWAKTVELAGIDFKF